MRQKVRRVGRPTKRPRPGDRVKLGLRVTAQTKLRLDAAAEKNGRSQSQEAEFRLDASFDIEGPFGGPAVSPLVMLLVGNFIHGGRTAAGGAPEHWTQNRDALLAAGAAVLKTLLTIVPNATPDDLKFMTESAAGRYATDLANRATPERTP
jgi:hypothetical protein